MTTHDAQSWPSFCGLVVSVLLHSKSDCHRGRAAGQKDCAERNWPCSQVLGQPGTPGWNKDARLASQGKCSKAWPAFYSWMPMNELISSFLPAGKCLLTHCH